MMPDSYDLSPRRARTLGVAAVLFMLVGVGALASIGLSALLPNGQATWNCENGTCIDSSDVVELAPEEYRAALRASPQARARFATHVDRPIVRAGLAGAVALENVPFAILMISVGMALRRFGARGAGALGRALPWLRVAAYAAIAMAIGKPVSKALTESLLSVGGPDGPYWAIPFNLGQLVTDLLLATAALAVAWALDIGSRATRDVAEFV